MGLSRLTQWFSGLLWLPVWCFYFSCAPDKSFAKDVCSTRSSQRPAFSMKRAVRSSSCSDSQTPTDCFWEHLRHLNIQSNSFYFTAPLAHSIHLSVQWMLLPQRICRNQILSFDYYQSRHRFMTCLHACQRLVMWFLLWRHPSLLHAYSVHFAAFLLFCLFVCLLITDFFLTPVPTLWRCETYNSVHALNILLHTETHAHTHPLVCNYLFFAIYLTLHASCFWKLAGKQNQRTDTQTHIA